MLGDCLIERVLHHQGELNELAVASRFQHRPEGIRGLAAVEQVVAYRPNEGAHSTYLLYGARKQRITLLPCAEISHVHSRARCG